MKPELVQIILNSVEVKCPLCRFTCNVKTNAFRCRSRQNLRDHLHKEHTETEARQYIRTLL